MYGWWEITMCDHSTSFNNPKEPQTAQSSKHNKSHVVPEDSVNNWLSRQKEDALSFAALEPSVYVFCHIVCLSRFCGKYSCIVRTREPWCNCEFHEHCCVSFERDLSKEWLCFCCDLFWCPWTVNLRKPSTFYRSNVDEAEIQFDLSADLRSVFNWNTKQLFLIVYAEFYTSKNVSDLIFSWKTFSIWPHTKKQNKKKQNDRFGVNWLCGITSFKAKKKHFSNKKI